VRLGFACGWHHRPEKTWSGTPWHLRAALAQSATVVDLGIRPPAAVQRALTLAYVRRSGHGWTSSWRYSRLWDAICQSLLAPRARRRGVDAVVQIQDLAFFDPPFYTYQDLSSDVVLSLLDQNGGRHPHFPMLDIGLVKRRRDRQHMLYERAAGVLAMSHWFARTLVELSGVPRHKVHVVYPGINVPVRNDHLASQDIDLRSARLLFVGRDFISKGGDLVVRAARILQRDWPKVTLTVAGPKRWPSEAPPPEVVTFLGEVSPDRVAQLMLSHDVFVMPSRFEAFGIVFLEALAHGLPCVARNAYAMPEIVVPGKNGALVESEDPAELAEAIALVLGNSELRIMCREEARNVVSGFSWEVSARQLLKVVRGEAQG
jgi:glycosyltransferase involved in cell wall biosynthesis